LSADTRAPGTAPSSLWFAALGPFEAEWDGQPLNLGGAKQQAVLALLVLEANRVVSVDRLLQWVWPDDDESRRSATLQVYVSNLRRLLAPAAEELGRQLIATQRPGYILELTADQSDVLRFEQLCREGEAASREFRPADAVTAFRSALGLWRGELLSGLPVDTADTGAAARLELVRQTVLEQTADAELAAGRHREFLNELQTWVAEHPLDEHLRGHLMVALYRCGRQADALAQYREVRHLLLEELGIDPSRELRDIEGRILAQDPSLDWTPARRRDVEVGPSTALRSSVVAPHGVLEIGDATVHLDGPVLTIGRLGDRDLVLDDLDVSRQHAEIRRSGTVYRLVDMGSANGTVLNGQRIADHQLADGDEIRLGGVTMTFRERA
jgi:SARP family transcriptional regulator, regulator of embCAB operon